MPDFLWVLLEWRVRVSKSESLDLPCFDRWTDASIWAWGEREVPGLDGVIAGSVEQRVQYGPVLLVSLPQFLQCCIEGLLVGGLLPGGCVAVALQA